jgi:hypothetical protein
VHPLRGWPFLSVPHHALLSALWAIFAHGALGILVLAPILLRSRRRLRDSLLAFAGASLIDLDHVFAATSVNLHRIETLGGRPATHCLLAALALALLAWAPTRNWTLAWCVFALNVSHLVFDAAGGGTPLLFPLSRPDAIPWLACPLAAAAMLWVSAMVARRGAASLPYAHPVDA